MKGVTQRPRAVPHEAFPLRTVAAMTGLTPDLIRAWEKRYSVVAPIRGARGARLYTSADIAHLRLLARVVSDGRVIGDVAKLSRAELEALAAHGTAAEKPGDAATSTPREDFIVRVLERLDCFDHAAVTRLLGDAVVGLGIRPFVHEIAFPLVQRIGARWADGQISIAEEHLFTGTLRNLLAGLVHGRASSGNPLVLATPSGERHEIGLLLVALLARDLGIDVVYLGIDLPAAEILRAAERSDARVIGLGVVAAANRVGATESVAAVHASARGRFELWLGGGDASQVAAGVESFAGLVLDTLDATEVELRRLAVGTQPGAAAEAARR